jgi:hypothetical protein
MFYLEKKIFFGYQYLEKKEMLLVDSIESFFTSSKKKRKREWKQHVNYFNFMFFGHTEKS